MLLIKGNKRFAIFKKKNTFILFNKTRHKSRQIILTETLPVHIDLEIV